MNGSVDVESKVGEGSTFWMEIPIEIHKEQCKIFDDLSDMLNLRIGLLTQSDKSDFQYESLLKYTNIFGMNTTLTASFEDDFDVFVFIHEDWFRSITCS